MSETLRWVCWVNQRIYTAAQNRCIRGPGDDSHDTCGWYGLDPRKDTP